MSSSPTPPNDVPAAAISSSGESQGPVSTEHVASAASPGEELDVVICDSCNKEISSIRYKCTVCKDFDLCSFCKALQRHPEHVLERATVDIDDETMTMVC